MNTDALAEIYVKQGIRDQGVLQDDIGQNTIQEVEEYVSRNHWNQNQTLKLEDGGKELAQEEIKDRISKINKTLIRREYRYAPFLIYLISERNSLPVRESEVSARLLHNKTDWMDFYLQQEDIWDEVKELLKYFRDQRLCFKTHHYVSGGKQKEEKYVWPQELSSIFRTPDLTKPRRKIRVYKFLEKALQTIDSDRSDHKINQRIYGYLSDYDLTEDAVRQTVEDLPDSLIENASEFLEDGSPFEYRKDRQKIVKGKIKDQLILDGMGLLQEFEEREKERIRKIVEKGEGRSREFKETLAYNTEKQRFEGNDEKICQEVSALANSGGGTLLIGVTDKAEIEGIDIDDEHDIDPYREELENQLKAKLPDNFVASFITYEFVEIEDDFICAIDVEGIEEPVFYGKGEFYVRSGSSSRNLSPQDALEYIRDHFERN